MITKTYVKETNQEYLAFLTQSTLQAMDACPVGQLHSIECPPSLVQRVVDWFSCPVQLRFDDTLAFNLVNTV